MFRRVPLSIIRSFSLYTQQWYTSYRFAVSTYTIAVCTVKNSWWWTEELFETCRVLFQKYIWEISASRWFYYKNLSRCTVTWTLKKKGLPKLQQLLNDKWVPVTTVWRVLRMRMEQRSPIWWVAANILNKQWRTADRKWPSSLEIGRCAYNSSA